MSTSDILTTTENILEQAENAIPILQGILSVIPGAQLIVPFLPLLPVAIEGVRTIQQATGATQSTATTVMRSHMTAGLPNAAALAGPSNAPTIT